MENTRTSREVNERVQVFFSDNQGLAAISQKADLAARNYKLGTYGYGADDVYQEVTTAIMDHLRLGGTIQGLVDGLLAEKVPAIADTRAKEAHSLAFAKLCASAAQRVKYRAQQERPVGDASAVMGEEVQKEQESVSPEESANGNDRQMTAVLARKGMMRGIHRADVYGVSDFSREAMSDNFTRFRLETDKLLTSALFDSNWIPATEAQRNAWNVAFWGESVADVLFGVNPTTGQLPAETAISDQEVQDPSNTPCVHDGVNYGIPWLNGTKCYYHTKVCEGLTSTPKRTTRDDPTDSGRRVYPVGYPYKPLKLTFNRTTTPKVGTPAYRMRLDRCTHCGHFHWDYPWYRKAVKLARMHEHDATCPRREDGTITCKLADPPTRGNTCPPGVVLQNRGLYVGQLLPESSAEGTLKALRRALLNFGHWVHSERNVFWNLQADKSAYQADIRERIEEFHKVGTGTPEPIVVSSGRLVWNSTIFPDEEASGKDARRFSILEGLGNLRHEPNSDIWDAFTIVLANVPDGIGPVMPEHIALPGVDRWNETLADMTVGLVHVGHDGNMSQDGVSGTFVAGVPGVIEHQRMVQDGRKVVKFLNAYIGYIALGWAGMPNGM